MTHTDNIAAAMAAGIVQHSILSSLQCFDLLTGQMVLLLSLQRRRAYK